MGEYFDWYDKNPDESSSLTVQFSKLMKVRKESEMRKQNKLLNLLKTF
jgi:hypothetical protein